MASKHARCSEARCSAQCGSVCWRCCATERRPSLSQPLRRCVLPLASALVPSLKVYLLFAGSRPRH
jgi:hypothetical protein